jgi:RNA polymerase sigma-70 factor (ECF subfamily)
MRDQVASRIKIGDEQAFELLFHKYYIKLCSFANKFLNEPEEARDVVQQVFIKIWECREYIDPDDSLNAYLFKITQNICINKLHRRKVESKYSEIYKLVYANQREITPDESLLSGELEKHIINAIDKIPPKCRRVFELSRIEGLKYVEIANVLHISVKTVEAQMSKAFRILRLELREYVKILPILISLSLL